MLPVNVLATGPQEDITEHDQFFQAFPLCICMLQAFKDSWWELPGNEAIPILAADCL